MTPENRLRYQGKTIMYETMRTFGFSHEQQRSDRNNYVTPINISSRDFNNKILGTAACDGPLDKFFSAV